MSRSGSAADIEFNIAVVDDDGVAGCARILEAHAAAVVVSDRTGPCAGRAGILEHRGYRVVDGLRVGRVVRDTRAADDEDVVHRDGVGRCVVRSAGEGDRIDRHDAIGVHGRRGAVVGKGRRSRRYGGRRPVVVLDPLVGIAGIIADPCRVLCACRHDAERGAGQQNRQRMPRNRPQSPPTQLFREFSSVHGAGSTG